MYEIESEEVKAPPALLEQFTIVAKIIGALAFGCFLGLSNIEFGIWWAAWCGIAPLLVLIRASKSWLEASLVGLAYGFAYNLLSLSWILGLYPLNLPGVSNWSSMLLVIIVWLLNSAYQAFLFLGFSVLTYALPMRAGLFPYYLRPYYPYVLSVAFIWTFFHCVIGSWQAFSDVFLNQLSYSQSAQLYLAQIARWGGCHFLDFLIILFNAAIVAVFLEATNLVKPLAQRADKFSSLSGAITDLVIVVLIVALGATTGVREALRISQKINILNLSQNVAWGVTVPVEVTSLVNSVTQGVSKPELLVEGQKDIPLIVLSGKSIDYRTDNGYVLEKAILKYAQSNKKEIVAGVVKKIDEYWMNTAERFSFDETNDLTYTRVCPNTVATLVNLPLPLLIIAPPLYQIWNQYVSEAMPLNSASIFKSIWGNVGVSTGLAVANTDLVDFETRHGAKLLINIADLSLFHNLNCNRQVLACAVLRAIEHRKYMILVTDAGNLAIIDPCGRIVEKTISDSSQPFISRVQFFYRKL